MSCNFPNKQTIQPPSHPAAGMLRVTHAPEPVSAARVSLG